MMHIPTTPSSAGSTPLNYLRQHLMKRYQSEAVQQRLTLLFDVLLRGFSSFVNHYANEAAWLKARLESLHSENLDEEQILQKGLKIAEENEQLYAKHANRIVKLREQYLGQITVYNNLKGGSIGDLRLLAGSTRSIQSFGNSNRMTKRLNQAAAAVELELYSMVGRLQIEINAIVGFARITPGDIFEVTVRHGSQKWKTRGKTQPDRTQKWDHSSVIFTCYPDCPLDIKATEVRFFKSKTLSERSFDPGEMFCSQSQLVTINLNQIGTLKLELIVHWMPLMNARNLNTVSSVYSSLSNENYFMDNASTSDAVEKKPRVLLREKKRTNQLMRQKEIWRSSTNILDSVYDDISKSIPNIDTVEALPVKRGELKKEASESLYLKNGWKRSISVSQLISNSNHDSLCERISSTSSVPTENELLYLLELIKPFVAKLIRKHPEIAAHKSCLNRWEKFLKVKDEVLVGRKDELMNRTDISYRDEHDENSRFHCAEQTSENDSGIDSLRQHISPYSAKNCATIDRTSCIGATGSGPSQRRFRQMKEKERRKSVGAIVDLTSENQRFGNPDELWLRSSTNSSSSGCSVSRLWDRTASYGISWELHLCLRHHLKRCLNILTTLTNIYGPLEYRENEMLGRLEEETSTLNELIKLASRTRLSVTRKNVLYELTTNSEVQELWLAAVFQLNATLIVPMESLRRQIRAHFGSIVEIRYPELVNNVIDTMMSLLTDKSTWEPEYISVFQFTNLFRGKHVTSFVENLAHEALIMSHLSSRQLNLVKEVMNRLSQVPVVPPLESLRYISLVLVCPDRHLQSIIESYLKSANGQLRDDLIMCYICLLEHENEQSRKGACRALGTLGSPKALHALTFLYSNDPAQSVREEAHGAISKMERNLQDLTSIETTKI
uniref:FAM65 N-terminal domain-containing protein n=1 Tax=Setaria digitata TaxID=48799 RepID=A0A915Q386_9BILA